MSKDNKEILDEIRDNYSSASESWSEHLDESRKDMKCIAGDPWDPEERKAREDAKRPVLALDEINQYLNQTINDLRQNKRGIKVIPKGAGASEKTAEFREGRIREIEYRSNAQMAYITGFEGSVSRGMGVWRVATEYVGDSGFEQEIVIRRIPNPDSVLWDPFYREMNCSDAGYCVVREAMPIELFKKKYPSATVQNFGPEERKFSGWISENSVTLAEYWKVKKTPRTLLLMDQQGTIAFLDEFKSAKLVKDKDKQFLRIEGHPNVPIVRSRKVEKREVCQYLTNGLEVLNYTEWPGKFVPIIPCFGKELWIDDGTGARRVLMSMVRLARDPYMLYCYYRTCEAELVGQVPKVPYVGYEGQFEDHEAEWANVNSIPQAYLEVKPMVDASGTAVLPLPRREMWEPPIQALEMGAESARRAIQAAMGISPLPTTAQRQNEKSGVALERIESSFQKGSFHFVDNFEAALKHCGDVINDVLDDIYDTEREVRVHRPDDSYELVKIKLDPETGRPTNGQGEHDVAITTGPSFATQMEEADDYLNALSKTALFPLVADLITKMKRMGPMGDQIAERLTPPQFAQKDGQQIPPAAAQAIQQGVQKLQALNEYAKGLEAKIGELEQEKQGKVVENEYRLEIEKLKIEADLAKAEITTKAQILNERVQFVMDMYQKLQDQAHEVGMQQMEQAHQAGMQAMSQPAEQEQV